MELLSSSLQVISPGRLAPSDAEWLLEGIVEYLKPCVYLFACKDSFFLPVTLCACHRDDRSLSL